MSINFFDADCQEAPISNALFGICDDQNGTKAFTNLDEPNKWIATVKNENNHSLTLTAVDKCVFKDDEQEGRKRCDCMLTSSQHIYFIELKDKGKHWQEEAIEQLESTIQFFMANHDINQYKHKKAFACNKKHMHFKVIDNETNLRFFREYKVRIDVQAEVVVV